MAIQDPGRAVGGGALTALPRVEDLPVADQGYDQQRVRDAFDAYRRHTLQLQAQLRVLQAAGGTARVEPTGHAVRMDALHLIRAAAEFADQLERDAQNASASQLRRAEEEIRKKQRDVKSREDEVERYRQESERQRAEMIGKARTEARDLLAAANRDATRELQEAEARGARLLEQARHQATELTNAARAEVEQTLEWARGQAAAVMTRAQQGAEQLLTAAGLEPEEMTRVVDAIVRAADVETRGRAPQSVLPQEEERAETGNGQTPAERVAAVAAAAAAEEEASTPDEPEADASAAADEEPEEQPEAEEEPQEDAGAPADEGE